MQKTLVAATLAAVLGIGGGAYAADMYAGGGTKDGWVSSDIIDSNNQITLQFIATEFGYKEIADGVRIPTEPRGLTLDTEGNWVPGFRISGSLMRNWFVSNLYVNAAFSLSDGSTDYKGALQSCQHPGCYGTVLGKDGATVYDYDFRLGKGFEIQRNLMLTPFFGIGWHEWNRKVNAGEDYSNGYYGGGLLLQWSPFSRFVLSADGLIGETFGSNIDVAGMGGMGGMGGFSGGLGNSTYYKAGVSGDYAVTRSIHVNAGVEWYGFNYGESAMYPVGCSSCTWEPDSRTNNVTAKVGLGFAFGAGYEPLTEPLK